MRASRAVALVAALIVSLGGCGKMQIRRGDLPEPPPKGLENLPQAPGYTRVTEPTAADVAAYCKANGVAVNDAYSRHAAEACVVPGLRQEVMPDPAVVNDAERWDADNSHETLHEYNVVHGPDGKGWYLAAPPPAGTDPKVVAALLSLPKAPGYANALTYTAAAAPTQPQQTAANALRP